MVGICIERSLEMMIGLLGILKAGGAYVPLEATYPTERLAFMLNDAGVSVLLVQRNLSERFADFKGQIAFIDDLNRFAVREDSSADQAKRPRSENAAYVIYTSGSTGKPKGVVITHSGLVNYVTWAVDAYRVAEGAGALVHSPISFDLTITGLFTPLLAGKCVFLMSEDEGVGELARALLKRDDYSLIKITPAHLRLLAELLPSNQMARHVRALIVGGEALRMEQLSFWRHPGAETRIINEYGPTETVVGCCVYEVQTSDPQKGSVPIGGPIASTHLYVLDQNLRQVAVGAEGELFIGGAGVARGYLNRPELTASRFVPDSFSGTPGGRLYRTGDLARYLPDGNIDYIGRIDNQVKLRGFRIELGEIEKVLAQHKKVRDCAADVRENERGEKRIVAYIVPAPGQPPRFGELRGFLKLQLPDYMVPTTFVTLEELPLTANGKVDRPRLPQPANGSEPLGNQVAARSQLELELRNIWQEVLSVHAIGIKDDFFELGGDSMAGVRAFTEIEKRLGHRLPLALLFQAPTVEQLAAAIEKKGWSSSWSSIVPMQPKGSRPPLFCVHACGAHVFIYRELVRRLGANQPVFGIQAPGLDGKQEPYSRIDQMAAHYVKEIRAFQPDGPYYLVGDTLGGLIALEMALQLTDQGQEVALLAMLDTFCTLPFGPVRRSLSHLVHLKNSGIRTYLRHATESVMNRLGKRSTPPAEVTVSQAEAAYTRKLDDPVERTEWGIYLATMVNYEPPVRVFPGKITYFLARDTRFPSRIEDNRLDWKRAARDFEVHVIPGRHDTIKEEPHVKLLAETLTSCLERP
jgi:amino acid adenylation domain-containing protein